MTFWCISYYSGAFRAAWLPYETRCKTGRTSAKVRARMSRWNFRNEHTRSIPLDPKLTFWCMSNHLGASRTVWLQKFVPRSRVGIFLNERSRSTPLDPKLTFWCVLYYLSAFGTVWLPLRNSVQNGPNKCKSSCDEVALEFFATNAPDPPHWTLN